MSIRTASLSMLVALTAAGAGLAFSAGPAAAAVTDNGLSANALTANGIKHNGMGPQGLYPQGMTPQGLGANDVPPGEARGSQPMLAPPPLFPSASTS
jgi:hypothetical protein